MVGHVENVPNSTSLLGDDNQVRSTIQDLEHQLNHVRIPMLLSVAAGGQHTLIQLIHKELKAFRRGNRVGPRLCI